MSILRGQQLRISAIRRSLGMTQSTLAGHMNVPQSTISRWEHKGSLHAASMERMLSLAREHERRQAEDLPPLRVAAAELAICLLEGRGNCEPLAIKVLQIVQGHLTHSSHS
jgi:transcriptional regulator with XRE-family HTH domain